MPLTLPLRLLSWIAPGRNYKYFSNVNVNISPHRPGFNAHAAAETAVLLAQGRVPANLSHGELAHYQAEQAVLAIQQNLQVQG